MAIPRFPLPKISLCFPANPNSYHVRNRSLTSIFTLIISLTAAGTAICVYEDMVKERFITIFIPISVQRIWRTCQTWNHHKYHSILYQSTETWKPKFFPFQKPTQLLQTLHSLSQVWSFVYVDIVAAKFMPISYRIQHINRRTCRTKN